MKITRHAPAPPKTGATPGDTVFFEAGERRRRGAATTAGMTHIGVTEMVDGTNVHRFQPVGDEHDAREA